MSIRRIFLIIVLVILLLVSFGIGWWWYVPGTESNSVVRSVRQALGLPVPTPTSMILTPRKVGGVSRSQLIQEKAILYTFSGILAGDVVDRGDGLGQGKLVVEGYLQQAPVEFLIGSLDGFVYMGIEQKGTTVYRNTPLTEALSHLKKGKQIRLWVQLDPNREQDIEIAASLDDLMGMVEQGKLPSRELPILGYQKVTVLE